MARTTRRKSVSTAGGLMLAPAVIAMRMPLLLAEANSKAGSGPESARMVSEKMAAMAAGAFAAQTSLMKAAFDFWPQAMSGRMPSLMTGEAQKRALDAASVPFGKAVSANYQRLGRKAV